MRTKVGKRPWGTYKVMAIGDGFKFQELSINPGEMLSYQYHRHRSEVWVFLEGEGVATFDGLKTEVSAGKTIFVPRKIKHRIHNTGDSILRFVEVQHGEKCEEDDFVMLDDIYGRLE